MDHMFIKKTKNILRRILLIQEIDDDAQNFIKHNKKEHRKKTFSGKKILVGLFNYEPMIYCTKSVLDWLRNNNDCCAGSYHFIGKTPEKLKKVYSSFGVRFELGKKSMLKYRDEALVNSSLIFKKLKTKEDVLKIRHNGILLGDLIYDSYLRYYDRPTVEITDPRLRSLIEIALMIQEATSKYMYDNNLFCFIADDYGYINCGIPTRVAVSKNIPVYLVNAAKKYSVTRLEVELDSRYPDYLVRKPYHHFKKLFSELSESQKISALNIGKNYIDSKISGQIDAFTLKSISAYGALRERALAISEVPKILVLMHDFFDSPHGYRHMLFPDFYEWINHLLKESEGTTFEWYVKPHPSVWEKESNDFNSRNKTVIEELKKKYPTIKWIHPETSNRQLVDEGIATVFTVYGTAGHEFAYLGIPVVNAADNPHINYSFNYHPATIEEYNEYIKAAGNLRISVNKNEIYEYCYMNYYYSDDMLASAINPIVESFFDQVPESGSCWGLNPYAQFINAEILEKKEELSLYYASVFDI
jgi:hypothetical protein